MVKKVNWLYLSLSLLFFFPANLMAQETPSVSEILSKSDQIRNPQTDYTLQVKITGSKSGREDSVSTYEVMVSGRGRTIVKTLSPAIDNGRVMLMLGKDMWIFLPNLSKPLRISLSERLTGEVSNGDIARANFTGDYNPTLSRTEQIDGKQYDVLDLAANAPDVTYGRVVLWVEEGTFNPLKAEFYAISGRLLKTCSYENFGDLGGAIRPTRIVMTDALSKDQRSVIEYGNIELKEIPGKYFTKDYMKKLSD